MSEKDPFTSLVEEGTLFAGEAAVPGRFFVDFFPWCKASTILVSIVFTCDILSAVRFVPSWFPGADFHSIATKGKQLSHDMRYIPYEETRDKIVRQ